MEQLIGAILAAAICYFLGRFIRSLFVNKAPVEEERQVSEAEVISPLPDVDGRKVEVDLFTLITDSRLASNVSGMFNMTRESIGGKICLVNLYFENGMVLQNVRIRNEKTVTLPTAFTSLPIKSVAVCNYERHMENPPMQVTRK